MTLDKKAQSRVDRGLPPYSKNEMKRMKKADSEQRKNNFDLVESFIKYK